MHAFELTRVHVESAFREQQMHAFTQLAWRPSGIDVKGSARVELQLLHLPQSVG